MRARGIRVLLCGVRAPIFESMQKTGLAKQLDEHEIFLEQPVRETSTLLAVRYAYELTATPWPTQGVTEPGFYYQI